MIFQKSACIETLYTELPFLERFRAARADGFEFVEFWSWTDKDLAAVKAAIAAEDKDYASSNMLVWFVDEQVEEEESAKDQIDALEQVEDNKLGLYMIDKELAARTYAQAAPLAGKA